MTDEPLTDIQFGEFKHLNGSQPSTVNRQPILMGKENIRNQNSRYNRRKICNQGCRNGIPDFIDPNGSKIESGNIKSGICSTLKYTGKLTQEKNPGHIASWL